MASKKIDDLAEFFDEAILPDPPIQLSAAEVITDPVRFLDGHFVILRANPGKRLFKPYFDRLEKFYLIIQNS